MTGKADAVRAVSQQFKDRTNAVIDGVMAHLRDDNAKEILGPGLSSLIGRGSLKSIVTFALYADVLRMVWDMVMADGEISDEEVQESLGLLAVVASGFAKVRKEYASFTQLTPETARQFLSQYESDSGLFGHANEATKWSGVTLCRNTQIHCSDPGPFDVFSDSLIAWAKKLAASDETAESEQDVLDSLHSITTRPGRILTKAIAEQFLKDPDSLSLQRFATLEDDAAAVLASSREDLRLSGLTQISAAAAQALMPHVGAILFGALETLTLPAAQALSQHIGPLRDLDVLRFVEKYPVFAALRRHPSLVVQVIEDESLTNLLRTKDIDNDEYYDFEFADAASRELCDEEYYGNPMDDGLHLLTRAEGRPVWRIPLSSVNDAWERDNAAAYTLYFIGDRDEVRARLESLPDLVLTKEIAAQHLGSGDGDFRKYVAIDTEAARLLGEKWDFSKDNLFFEGLRSLSREAAEALSQAKPEDSNSNASPGLCIWGLNTLPEAVAKALGSRRWELSVRITSLSPEVSAALSGCSAIAIVGLETLSPEAAKSLATFEGDLQLDSLVTLSDDAAEALAQHKGPFLLLQGLCTVSDKAAAAFAKYKGTLNLSGVTTLSKKAAEALRSNPGIQLPDHIEIST